MTAGRTGRRVVVGMSGGVDSSVAAALLKEQGWEVIGVMLRLWSPPEKENRCCAEEAMLSARRVAGQLEIPFYTIDARKVFHTQVVQSFINGYAQGITPNPCLVCNRFIRWGFLMERAEAFGADFLATGHYARLETNPQGQVKLLKADDPLKDQSYVLHVLDQAALQKTLLPLGSLTKDQVREIARSRELPVANRPDSQDLCFTGPQGYREFLAQSAPDSLVPGPILNTQGKQLGEHPGLAHFTIGQRKGLGISPPQPHYVIEKIAPSNTLIVGPREELGRDQLTAANVNWIAGSPPRFPFRAGVKIRYRAPEKQAVISLQEEKRVTVKFDQPLPDITPGQAAVFYQDEICLGGGIITRD